MPNIKLLKSIFKVFENGIVKYFRILDFRFLK